MTVTRNTSVRLPVDVAARLDEHAEQNGTTRQAVIVDAIRRVADGDVSISPRSDEVRIGLRVDADVLTRAMIRVSSAGRERGLNEAVVMSLRELLDSGEVAS